MRYLVAILCGVIIVVKGVYPAFTFDEISLGLLVLGAVFFVLGNPNEIHKRKRVGPS